MPNPGHDEIASLISLPGLWGEGFGNVSHNDNSSSTSALAISVVVFTSTLLSSEVLFPSFNLVTYNENTHVRK